MEPAEEVAVVVFRGGDAFLLRDGIQESDEEELEGVSDEDLFWVFLDECVVWDTPTGWVVL